MSVQITNLYFSYPSSHSVLFEDFSLQIYGGWTCVAGSNGSGKSTLLKLISGLISPDSGKIAAGGETVYCPQESSEMPENLYNAFWSGDNDARRFFSQLHVTEEMLDRYESLSGGEKKRIQIACALSEKPSVLLLDEPTNHLDSAASKMISDALRLFDGIGIMVSHDRSFSDLLCTRTVFLFNESHAFSGGRDCTVYDSYPCALTKALELRKNNSNQSRGEWEKLNSKLSSEKQRSRKLEAENEKSKSRLSKKSSDPKDHDAQRKIDIARISGKDRTTGDAKARLETQIRQTESARDSIKKSLQRKEGFAVSETAFSKSIIIEETVFSPGDSYTLFIPHIEISPCAKIALTGQNGSGKSLFIKHLVSELEKNGRADEVMYLPQEISLDEEKKIFSDFTSLEESERGEVLSTLYRLGSEPESLMQIDSADKKSLSPGELRKLMIALAVQKPLSILILDEPTNHMDITSVLALENALASLNCALLVVSHDESFLQKVTKERFVAKRNGNTGKIERGEQASIS